MISHKLTSALTFLASACIAVSTLSSCSVMVEVGREQVAHTAPGAPAGKGRRTVEVQISSPAVSIAHRVLNARAVQQVAQLTVARHLPMRAM